MGHPCGSSKREVGDRFSTGENGSPDYSPGGNRPSNNRFSRSMIRDGSLIFNMKMAEFTATACALANEAPDCGMHHSSPLPARSWRAFDLRMATKVQNETYLPYSASSAGESLPLL